MATKRGKTASRQTMFRRLPLRCRTRTVAIRSQADHIVVSGINGSRPRRPGCQIPDACAAQMQACGFIAGVIRFDGERRSEKDTVHAGPAIPVLAVRSMRRIPQSCREARPRAYRPRSARISLVCPCRASLQPTPLTGWTINCCTGCGARPLQCRRAPSCIDGR
jgi:hypothetical protein